MKHYDVVVLGGAFSGASAALLLRREMPDATVLVVERAPAFDAKVGEATTEMSAMFLTRRLAMWEHLEREQLPKEGLRYWFTNERVRGHADASETGGFLRSAIPSFQLRRDALDEHLLATAAREGAELRRPARVQDVALGDFDHRVTIDGPDGVETVSCRWVLDATGRATVLGRRLGIIDRNREHPTAAVWARWKNVRHIDDVAARGPVAFARRGLGSRRLSTNHYMGLGYWVWVIPLGNGETSIGVVYDTRLMSLADGPERERSFREFLLGIPSLAELLEGAELAHRRPALVRLPAVRHPAVHGAGLGAPRRRRGVPGPVLLAGAGSRRVHRGGHGGDREGGPGRAGRRARGSPSTTRSFVRSYHRFFQAVYRDKYYYMGEQDLLTASFLLDTAQYYLFVVMPAYKLHGRFHWMPVLGPGGAGLNYALMKLYNRRFKALALARRRVGEEGRRNDGRRVKPYFAFGLAPLRMAARGLRFWALAELDGLRLLLKRRRVRAPASAEADASRASVSPR